jgi:type I restriction enzyme S subunit
MGFLRGKEESYYYNSKDLIKVDSNQLLILWDGSNAGEFIHSKEGYLSSTMAVLRHNNLVLEKFFYYSCKYFEPKIKDNSIGMGIPHVNGHYLSNLIVSLPPLSEQEQIAAYLDHKTSKIDALIEMKQRLIALLEEERTALINQAVTKGLDPTAPLKDSGIDWLGQIPSHWAVKKLKYVAVLKNGYAFSSEIMGNKGVPIIRIGDLVPPFVIIENAKRIPFDKAFEYKEFSVSKGDFLIALTGATVGKIATYTYNELSLLNQRVGRIMPKSINKRFLGFHLLLQQYSLLIDRDAVGGAQGNLSLYDYGNYPFFNPPLSEQEQIAAYLDEKTAQLDALKAQYQQLITLLEEYKTALISDVVTGKVDVRGE